MSQESKKDESVMTDVSNKFSVSEMAELAISAKKAGWCPGEFGTLANNHRQLGAMHDVVSGFAEIRYIVHSIDGDSLPEHVDFEDDLYGKIQFRVHNHSKLGELLCERRGENLWINDRRVELRTDQIPVSESFFKPTELREWIEEMKGGDEVLDASVAEFLRKNPELIPLSWSRGCFLFPGTIWRAYWLDGTTWKDSPKHRQQEYVLCWQGGRGFNHGLNPLFAQISGDQEERDPQRFLPTVLPVLAG